MSDPEVYNPIRTFVVEQILDQGSVAVDADTPLLEWGVLNSLSTTQLVGFIHERFGVHVPAEEMIGGNFKDLRSITALVGRLREENGSVRG